MTSICKSQFTKWTEVSLYQYASLFNNQLLKPIQVEREAAPKNRLLWGLPPPPTSPPHPELSLFRETLIQTGKVHHYRVLPERHNQA